MTDIIPDLLRGLVTIVFVGLIIFALAKPKLSNKKILCILISLMALSFFRDLLCYLKNNYTLIAKSEILFLVLIFIFAKPLFKDTVMQWIFNCVTIMNIYISVVILSFELSRFMPFPKYFNTLVRVILFLAIFILLYRYGRPVYREVKKNWNIFIFPVTAILVNYIWLFLRCDNIVVMLSENAVELLMLVVITVGVYLSIFYSLKVTAQKYRLSEENIKNHAREQLLHAELLSYEESVFMAKQSRHDLRHHNAVILEYLECGDIESAKEYLKQQNKELNKTALHEFCKNPVCNAVIRMYERRTSNLGIYFGVIAEIPQNVPFTAPELGAVLSNILENACESCEKSDLIERYIKLSLTTDSDRLLIEVCNTVSGEVEFNDGMPQSQKDTGGTGTKSVSDIVKRYNGMVQFMQNDNEFVTHIILPLNQ